MCALAAQRRYVTRRQPTSVDRYFVQVAQPGPVTRGFVAQDQPVSGIPVAQVAVDNASLHLHAVYVDARGVDERGAPCVAHVDHVLQARCRTPIDARRSGLELKHKYDQFEPRSATKNAKLITKDT